MKILYIAGGILVVVAMSIVAIALKLYDTIRRSV